MTNNSERVGFLPINIRLIVLSIFLMVFGNLFSQLNTDTIHRLDEVVVSSDVNRKKIRSTTPLQLLTHSSLANMNALQLSDAIKYFSGVTVKDYGGVGGLKTLSVRSLGANHTAVSYEGITITDVQTGQIDIGRFSLANVDMLSLNVGQGDDIFQSARLFASGSVLKIKTLRPSFEDGRATKGSISLKAGSWKLLNPTFNLQQKISDKFALDLSGEYLKTDGQYPYTLHYGFVGSDSTSNELRKNTDVKNLRIEATLFANFSDKEEAQFKLYYYGSERGLPGATIFYNTDNFSSQRLWDNTFFAQGSYQKQFSSKWKLLTKGKYNRGYLRYLDPTFLNIKGKEENNYTQQEYYLSGVLFLQATKNLSFSLSNDISFTDLKADLYQFSYPTRWTNLTALATKYVSEHFLSTASLLSTVVREDVKTGKAGNDYQQLSPYVGFSVKPFLDVDFRIRTFYKNIFRMPTFNDLYYSRIGNPNLKPEKTNQFNVGATFQTSLNDIIPHFAVTADLYHNDVKDKIVAYPTKNIFVWTMLNYGKVSMDGFDVNVDGLIQLLPKYNLVLNSSYSYQRALNKTDKNGRAYLHQIPYTPRVSGSNRVSLQMPIATLSYSMLWSGKRYILQQNYAENRLEGYAEHNITASTHYAWGRNILKLKVEVLNLLNENYAVVRYFPMPGRSWRATLSYNF